MTNRFLEKPLTHYAMLLVTILGKKLFTKLRLILLFISINSKSQHGSVPYHLNITHSNIELIVVERMSGVLVDKKPNNGYKKVFWLHVCSRFVMSQYTNRKEGYGCYFIVQEPESRGHVLFYSART